VLFDGGVGVYYYWDVGGYCVVEGVFVDYVELELHVFGFYCDCFVGELVGG